MQFNQRRFNSVFPYNIRIANVTTTVAINNAQHR